MPPFMILSHHITVHNCATGPVRQTQTVRETEEVISVVFTAFIWESYAKNWRMG